MGSHRRVEKVRLWQCADLHLSKHTLHTCWLSSLQSPQCCFLFYKVKAVPGPQRTAGRPNRPTCNQHTAGLHLGWGRSLTASAPVQPLSFQKTPLWILPSFMTWLQHMELRPNIRHILGEPFCVLSQWGHRWGGGYRIHNLARRL